MEGQYKSGQFYFLNYIGIKGVLKYIDFHHEIICLTGYSRWVFDITFFEI